MTADQINCVNKAVWDAVPDKENYDFVELSSLSSAERLALCQQHLISPEFAEKNDGRAVIMNKDRSICIMLCEEDHVRIQVLCAGFDLKKGPTEPPKKSSRHSKRSCTLPFDKDLGYLTECPTNLGTGMRASVMIHLPALEAANGIEALSRAVGKIGLTLRGTYGEGLGSRRLALSAVKPDNTRYRRKIGNRKSFGRHKAGYRKGACRPQNGEQRLP